jgi:hypothetical protein
VNDGGDEVMQKRGAVVSSAPVRIGHKTKAKLEQLLRQANKDRVGRKVKADDLIALSLGLITDVHIAEICDRTRSNKDRVELLFRKLSKERRGISREEFLGMLLDGTLNGNVGTGVAVAVENADGRLS